MSLTRAEVLGRIGASGIIAVIRAGSPAKALELARAVRAGGIDVIEITFTVPEAAAVIGELRAERGGPGDLIVGAGTVLEPAEAAKALEAGADFVVSPALDLEIVRKVAAAGTVVIPGCMTVTEIVAALRSGADAIKLFPSGVLGPGFVKAVRAPLPGVRLIPTGGVSLENVGDWLRAGCLAVGVGGELTAAGTPAAVTKTATAFVARIRAARSLGSGGPPGSGKPD